jgi:serine O-acetyltransferase
MFENIRADFHAHGRNWGAQGFWALTVYRFGRWRYTIRSAIVRKPLSLVYHLLNKWIQIVAGIEFPCEVTIGPNFVIDHSGGIVISGYVTFGANCRIRNGVVVGLAHVSEPTAPQIGDDVDIGAGAKVLGAIRIGNNVAIGANAVVIRDVPDDHIAVGVPAVNRPRRARTPLAAQAGDRARS